MKILGKKAFLMVIFREFFMICVPLFLILIGYLNNKKELSKKYYQSLLPKILIYIVAAICQLLFMKFYQNENLTFLDALYSILNFDIHYAWYINMYFGLFLLIPFLNLIYSSLKDKKQKQFIIIILLILTCVPSLFTENKYLISDWWTNIYPLTYYFIGCYLSEFKINISKAKNYILLIALTIIYGVIIYHQCLGTTYIKEAYNHEWYGIMPLSLSILCFNLLLNFNLGKISKWLKDKLVKISNLVFAAYLVSWIFDSVVYTILNDNVILKMRIYYAPLCVLTVFIGSIILSYFINCTVNFIMKILDKVINKILKKQNVSIS
jgi:surface polysaccharide O-acyltransferase-like enzyme